MTLNLTKRGKAPDIASFRLLASLIAQAEQQENDQGYTLSDWQHWHSAIYGEGGARLSQHHRDMWAWAWSIMLGEQSPSFFGIWARGGAKSTTAERIVAMLGALDKRRYVGYVCATQDQADDHVDAIAAILESPAIQRHYPSLGRRLVGKYGASKGWRRSRIRTSTGFTVDAFGLDKAIRGKRIEDARPDFFVLDDIDDGADSEATTKKKIRTLTSDIIPAGSTDRIVLFIQNLIHEDSIASQLLRGDLKMLTDRIVSGPHPALRNLETERETLEDGRTRDVITGGEATWEGQGIEECQALIDLIGLDAFLVESQHEVSVPLGGLFDGVTYRHCDAAQVPDLVDVQVVVDPAVTSTDRSDSHGITVAGIDANAIVYILWSYEQISTPEQSLSLAIRKGMHYKASTVTVETDQGGDLWQESYERIAEEFARKTGEYQAARIPAFNGEKAGSIGSKVHRANMLLQAYKRSEIVHVRNVEHTHLTLEKALRRFPLRKPFDLVDSEFWAWWMLTNGGRPGFW